MPNTFAYAVLFIWPLITLLLFQRYKVLKAVLFALILSILYLPVKVSINLPYVLPLNKQTVPVLALMVLLPLFARRKIPLIPTGRFEKIFFAIFVFSPLLTTIGNGNSFMVGRFVAQGFTFYDGVAQLVTNYITLVPYLLGAMLVNSYADHKVVFRVVMATGLFYSSLILFELVMSPQLHRIMYGFFPHDFSQHMRYGGFRPVVFLGHGLSVSFFTMVSLCSAYICWKARVKFYGISASIIALYLFIILVASKSLGSILLVLVFLTAVSLRNQLTKSTFIALCSFSAAYVIVLFFTAEIHYSVVNLFAYFSPERADSLLFRITNEYEIIQHVKTKLAFGWGGWARGRTLGSTVDSTWIVQLSSWGLLGLLSLFGLIFLSIKSGLVVSKFSMRRSERVLIVCHIGIVSLLVADQVVNSSLLSSPLYLFLIGALSGRANFLWKARKNNVYANQEVQSVRRNRPESAYHFEN